MKSKVFIASLLLFLLMSVFSFAAVDLKFTSAVTMSPADAKAGDTMTFSVSFRPEGAAVSNLKVIGGIDGAQKYERVFASINADGTRTCSFTWTATPGSHVVFFTLDPLHTTGDSSYSNNRIEKQFAVTDVENAQFDPKIPNPEMKRKINFNIFANDALYRFKPDLIVSQPAWSPLEEPKCNKKWRMWVKVKNVGQKMVPKNFTIAISVQGILASEMELGSGLQPGNEVGYYFDWYIINDAYVRIVADFYNVIDESNEENNALWPKVTCEK
jgi:subtilase family serine protease